MRVPSGYTVHEGINLLTAFSFLIFGFGCFASARMKGEFRRYGLGRYRLTTGALQVAGALGLLAGTQVAFIGFAASLGLSVLMLLGVRVRRRIGDTWWQSFPALFYFLLAGILCFNYLSAILSQPAC
ncbi:MAG: DoxX family protein [Oceanipulchritudo sp.]